MVGIRLWPPASSLASSPCCVSSRSASSSEVGARYSNAAGYTRSPQPSPRGSGSLYLASPRRRGSLHLFRGPLHRLDDLEIAGAATQVAVECLLDLVLGRRRVVSEQVGCRHDHPGGA